MKKVKVKTYAKINLVLNCLGKREDGYHELSSIMQAISLHDNINIAPAEGIEITVNHPKVPTDEKNFAYLAAKLIMEKYKIINGVKIDIDKCIPIEAGLAGGSTNAAGVILGMNKLFKLNMTLKEMYNIAEKIGSDVPFCLEGPTALATGRGEKIISAPECPSLWVVLLKPDFGVKTAKVYQNMKEYMFKDIKNTDEFIEALAKCDKDYILSNMANTLEKSTFELYPKVKEYKDYFMENASAVLMAGSGPTIFAVFKNKEEAERFKSIIPEEYGKTYLASTISNQIVQERVEASD